MKPAHIYKRLNTDKDIKISCPEEIAYRLGYIDAKALEKLAQPLAKNGYGQYLLQILKEENA